jgi:hypothetical protein
MSGSARCALPQAGERYDRSGERGVGLRELLPRVFLNQLACRGFAPTTAPADRELHLHFAKSRCALLDSATNLTVGDSMAHTNIHRDPYALPGGPATERAIGYIRMRMIVNYDIISSLRRSKRLHCARSVCARLPLINLKK